MTAVDERQTSTDTGGSTGTVPRYDWMGTDRDQRGHAAGSASGEGAPTAPGYGLTSTQLHGYQRMFTRWAADRILGVGREQYDYGTIQKFERKDPEQLVEDLREELADIVNYAAMIDIQLQRLHDGLSAVRTYGK